MNDALEKLLDVSSDAICAVRPVLADNGRAFQNPLTGELFEILKRKNGFYAFESALHVYSTEAVGGNVGLFEWNSPSLWIAEYGGMADGCLFFAEDIFGVQFCIKSEGIFSFEPETGALTFLSASVGEWAEKIMLDYDLLTGHKLAKSWQEANGAIASGNRLMPKTPFVLGGEFSRDNLFSLNAVKGMRARADLALQIRDLPDGASVQWKVVD
jgi:hypothetical protein